MEVGISLNILQQQGRSDAAVMRDHMAMGDLAEPLGLDSIFALEHHFTGYSMSPQPTQLLAYFAGRTKRVKLGTAVIVLPWHDPVRVAEMIARKTWGMPAFGNGPSFASTRARTRSLSRAAT